MNVVGPVVNTRGSKTGVALGFLAGSSLKITTLCWTPGSWLSNASAMGLSASTLSVVGANPVAAAPFGAAIVIACASPPVGSPLPIARMAMPPASIATPATAPIIENNVLFDRRSREATRIATAMMATVTTRATAVAACPLKESSTRENPKSTSPIATRAPTGSRIGRNKLCRDSGCGSGGSGVRCSSVIWSVISSTPNGSPARRHGSGMHPIPHRDAPAGTTGRRSPG